ncbi:S1 family peptidase [Dictyobacter aurantiacus]|uniref:Peptidase S1 domain-containing protein n=1 Tax=Dictyobacter aurantiacus TaxID=1936993 RepID=A0A401ZBQ5_9CHLR|nr:serine protease [Dictyobacter aurantiacus]GCE04272.1 hypothetical protein KDAU_16010 [Dictyobacter aurantiacus]
MGITFFLACFHSFRRKKLALISLSGFISFLCIFVTAGPALADATPGGNISNPVIRAVDLAKPAVVRIITTVGGRLSVQFTDTQSATFPLDGGYYDLKLSGSGTFISSHGDILTADHVIQPPRDKSMDDVLQMTAAQDVADYINMNFHPQTPYSAQDTYSNMAFGIFRTQSTYQSPKSEVFLSRDYAGVINANQLSDVSSNFHAQVNKIEQESAVDQRDVAIIHVNMEDTPSVQLDDSSNVSQQDELTIIGFPGNGDLGDPTKPDPTTYLTSSVNKIYVSAIKEHVIQVGGNVEHGDSGGPALNSHGNVVGVVSFYNQDAQTPVGTSFLQTSSSAQELITNLKIDTKPGKFQTAWEQAFNQYTSTGAGHWHQAYADFQKLQKDYPSFQAVNPFLDYASQQARHEKQPQSAPNNTTALLITAAIVFVIVIVLAVLVGLWFARRRSKSQPAYQYNYQNNTQAPQSPYNQTSQNFGNPYAHQPSAQSDRAGAGNWPQPYMTSASIATTEEADRPPDSQPSRPARFESPQTPEPALPWPPATPAPPAFPQEAISPQEQANPAWESPMAAEPTERQQGNGADNRLPVKRIKTNSSLDWPTDLQNYYVAPKSVLQEVEQVPFPLDRPQDQPGSDEKHEATDKMPAIARKRSDVMANADPGSFYTQENA